MSVPCFLSSAARSFSLSCPAAGLFCCRLRGPSSTKGRRNMSSKRQMDHLERTASNTRQNALYPAQVCGIMNESETVKRLRIAVHPDFSFKAGQWVDFFIPGVEKVGGFSMCSSPGLLQREGVIELAVKYTKHPPAHWVHTTCTVGSQVAMRVGGDFFFDPTPSDPSMDLLLVAGGVGINPLYSILLHTTDLLHLNRASAGRDYNIGSVHLCYSAKNTQELLFKLLYIIKTVKMIIMALKNEAYMMKRGALRDPTGNWGCTRVIQSYSQNSIIEAHREFPDKFSCDFHITQQSTDVDPHLQPFLNRGRISEEELRAHVDPERTLCFLCGPPPMIEAISKTLMDIGLPKDRILFEKWW